MKLIDILLQFGWISTLTVLLFSCDRPNKVEVSDIQITASDSPETLPPIPAPPKFPTVSESEGLLIDETVTIVASYSAISCPCAQWLDIRDSNLLKSDSLPRFYLEPASDTLPIADALWDGRKLPFEVRVKGQFYKGLRLPNFANNSKGNPEPGRVFRYEALEVSASK